MAELGVEVCMTECDEEVMDMMVVMEVFDDYGGYNNYGYGNDGFDDRMRDGRGMGGHGWWWSW